MSGVSTRREFFQRFIKFDTKSNLQSKDHTSSIYLGKLNEFPVDSKNRVVVEGETYLLHSFSEGLRLTTEDQSKSFAISMSREGKLYGHLDRKCENNSIFSILTGEIYSL